jgi:hypothetical protein
MPSQEGYMLKEGFLIDKIKWIIGQHPKRAVPLCPRDFVRLTAVGSFILPIDRCLKCEECGKVYSLPRDWDKEQEYVLNKIDSKFYKSMKFINLDDEALPIAEDRIFSKDNKYFVKSLLTESKTGIRLVVYAGEKGRKEKTQIFVEPGIKRLAFDQNDIHPTDIFTKLEATFADGTKNSQEKGTRSKKPKQS